MWDGTVRLDAAGQSQRLLQRSKGSVLNCLTGSASHFFISAGWPLQNKSFSYDLYTDPTFTRCLIKTVDTEGKSALPHREFSNVLYTTRGIQKQQTTGRQTCLSFCIWLWGHFWEKEKLINSGKNWKARIWDGAGLELGESDSMKLCTIRLTLCLAVSQHSKPGAADCESPPVCSLKPLQAGGRGPRHFNRLTLLQTSSKPLKSHLQMPQCTVSAVEWKVQDFFFYIGFYKNGIWNPCCKCPILARAFIYLHMLFLWHCRPFFIITF